MQKIPDLTKAFAIKIQSLYDIEHQLLRALPKLEKAAASPDLKDLFREHQADTEEHVKRLERVFKMLEMAPKKKRVEGIRGIIADGEWVARQVEAAPALKDAMLAAAARYAEHYETAGYLSAIGQANALGYTDAAVLLTASLNEEMAADEALADEMAVVMDSIA